MSAIILNGFFFFFKASHISRKHEVLEEGEYNHRRIVNTYAAMGVSLIIPLHICLAFVLNFSDTDTNFLASAELTLTRL